MSDNGDIRYFVTDHLGSTTRLINTDGTEYSETEYLSWGYDSLTPLAMGTSFKYTGQRQAEAGLYFYNARWYDPELGRFIQADTIIPSPGNPLAWDRYAYANNNPLYYTDLSGHTATPGEAGGGNPGQAEYDAQRNAQLNCQAGNETYCSYAQLHPVETVAFVGGGLLVAGALSAAVGGTSAATATGYGSTVSSTLGGLCADGDCGNEARVVSDTTMSLARGLGRYGEMVSQAATQLGKNTEHIVSITRTAAYRIPDLLIKANLQLNIQGVLTEIKNVSVLRQTPQLTDFALWTQQNGYQFNIILRSSAVNLLPLEFIQNYGVNIIRNIIP